MQEAEDLNDHGDRGRQSIVPDSGRARTKNREGPGGARGILNFGQLSPHTRTWPAVTTAAAMYTCDVQPAVVRVDFVHGVGGQKSRGRRTLMPVRACVRTLEIRASRLEKRDATGK